MSLDTLIEKYLGRASGVRSGISVEVFKNPTAKEMRDASRENMIRFIANLKDKSLYVWRYDKAFHVDVWEKFINRNEDESLTNLTTIWGVAKKSGSEWEMISSDSLKWLDFDDPFLISMADKYGWLNRFRLNVEKWLTDTEWRNTQGEIGVI